MGFNAGTFEWNILFIIFKVKTNYIYFLILGTIRGNVLRLLLTYILFMLNMSVMYVLYDVWHVHCSEILWNHVFLSYKTNFNAEHESVCCLWGLRSPQEQ